MLDARTSEPLGAVQLSLGSRGQFRRLDESIWLRSKTDEEARWTMRDLSPPRGSRTRSGSRPTSSRGSSGGPGEAVARDNLENSCLMQPNVGSSRGGLTMFNSSTLIESDAAEAAARLTAEEVWSR